MISVSWTAFAAVTDIRTDYSVGRVLSDYIIKNELENYLWTSLWMQDRDDDGELIYEDIHQINGSVVETNPYLSKPLTGIQSGGTSYMDHILVSKDEATAEISALRERGTDIIIGIPLGGDYLERLGVEDKLAVAQIFSCNRVWKNNNAYYDVFIIMGQDLARIYSIEE